MFVKFVPLLGLRIPGMGTTHKADKWICPRNGIFKAIAAKSLHNYENVIKTYWIKIVNIRNKL